MRWPFRGRDGYSSLHRWEWAAIALIALVTAAFGAITLHRSAFMQRRMTDADVYFRAAWALRAGEDPYAVKDPNGWTYLYPPALAIALMPLADPPPGVPMHPAVPYPLSIVIWYALGAGAMLWSIHLLCATWEETSEAPRVRTLTTRHRRWWAHRVLLLLACAGPMFTTLGRGQVNLLVLLALAFMVRWAARRRDFAAGLALSAAVVVKLFPLFLALHFALRRNWRGIAGCALGLAMLLYLLPLTAFGHARTIELNRSFAHAMLLPSLGLGGSQAKIEELGQAYDNQSLFTFVHRLRHWKGVDADTDLIPDPTDKAIVLALSAALTSLACLVILRPSRPGISPARADMLSIGVLASLMLVFSPVTHDHYYVFHAPLLAALIGLALDHSPTVDMSPRAYLLLAAYGAIMTLSHLPLFEPYCRSFSVLLHAGLALTLVGLLAIASPPRFARFIALPADGPPTPTP